jgi:hypothetical protein
MSESSTSKEWKVLWDSAMEHMRDADTARAHIASLLAVLDDKHKHLAWDVRALMIAAAREYLSK